MTDTIPDDFPTSDAELKQQVDADYRRACWILHCDVIEREAAFAARWGKPVPPTPVGWYPPEA